MFPNIKRITEETKQFIIDHPDMPQKKIAKICGCSQQAVSHWARKLGICKKEKLTDEEIVIVRDFMSKNPFATVAQAANALDLPNHRIRMAIAGISNSQIGMSKIDLNELNDYLIDHPKAKKKEIADYFNVTYPTAKKAIERLNNLKENSKINKPVIKESKVIDKKNSALSKKQQIMVDIIARILELNPEIETIEQLRTYL